MEKEIDRGRILTTIKALNDAAVKAEECSKYLQKTVETTNSLSHENSYLRHQKERAELKLHQLERENIRLEIIEREQRNKENEYKDAIKKEQNFHNDTQKCLQESLQRQDELERKIKEMEKPKNEDISDDKRPTKVAEKLRDLYETQWMDAFEEIEKYFDSEEKITQELLKIFKKVMKFCTEVAKRQDEKIHDALLNNREFDNHLLNEISRHLSSCKKSIFSITVEDIYMEYISKHYASESEGRIQAYVKECVSVCWMCLIQFPPMKLELDTDVHREEFKKDVYSAYTISGDKIDFLVWPVLRRHENGLVVEKGVAQGLKEKPKQSMPERSRARYSRKKEPFEMGVSRSSSCNDLKRDSSKYQTKAFNKVFGFFRRSSRGLTKSTNNLAHEN